LDPLPDLTINEIAGPHYVVLTGISSGAANENQTLTLAVSNSNPAVLAGLALIYVSPEQAGVLSFRAVPGASGVALITLALNDGGGSNNLVIRSFTVRVGAVDSPPAISVIPDQTVSENTASGSIAFAIGDSDTTTDSLLITAVSLNPALLPPANVVLGGSGNNRTLDLLPATNQTGVAIVVVTVSDGTFSATSAFEVTVIAGTGPARPILQISRVGGNFQMSLATQIGQTYALEYKNSLADPVWNPLSTVAGTGQTVTIMDAVVPSDTRFFRVRIQ